MPFFETLLLSFVQSATEFLPVSSSGHLVLMEKFGFSNQTLLMDISLHVGTVFPVIAFFYKDIFSLLKGFYKNRILRVLLVFILTSLGSTIGTFIGGADIIGQLADI